jgi:hypothetical protein
MDNGFLSLFGAEQRVGYDDIGGGNVFLNTTLAIPSSFYGMHIVSGYKRKE